MDTNLFDRLSQLWDDIGMMDNYDIDVNKWYRSIGRRKKARVDKKLNLICDALELIRNAMFDIKKEM